MEAAGVVFVVPAAIDFPQPSVPVRSASSPYVRSAGFSPYPPAITGVGLVSALGAGAENNWRKLMAGQFIEDHSKTILSDAGPARIIEIALAAAREAINDARWTARDLMDDQTALVVGTSKGQIESCLTPPLNMDISPYIAGGFGLASLADCLARRLGIGSGPRMTFSAACASGLHALIRACLMLRSGEARRALVIASEASVHPLFLGSFRRLGLLAPTKTGCRPFDERRRGFLMSEAAAATCLTCDDGGAVVIDRCAMASDSTHITAADPQGAALTHVLSQIVAGRDIDLIHAHGTATVQNDPIELAAIQSAVARQSHPAHVYSHKGALGHSLGASGLVSVVLSCMMHKRGVVLPNTRTSRPLRTKGITIAQRPVETPIGRSIVLAAGFGGALAAVGLESSPCK